MEMFDTAKYFVDPHTAAFVDAVQLGDVPTVSKKLFDGFDANAQGLEGFRPIHFAFVPRSGDVLELLLKNGADPRARLADGNEPLNIAVRFSQPEFTRMLLKAGADPNQRGANEKPPLHEALHSHSPAVIEALVSAGSQIDEYWGGGTPLMRSIIMCLWTMAETLLRLGADPNLKNSFGSQPAELLCERASIVPHTLDNCNGITQVANAFNARGIKCPCDELLRKFDKRPPNAP